MQSEDKEFVLLENITSIFKIFCSVRFCTCLRKPLSLLADESKIVFLLLLCRKIFLMLFSLPLFLLTRSGSVINQVLILFDISIPFSLAYLVKIRYTCINKVKRRQQNQPCYARCTSSDCTAMNSLHLIRILCKSLGLLRTCYQTRRYTSVCRYKKIFVA